jgi:hypothetical protein
MYYTATEMKDENRKCIASETKCGLIMDHYTTKEAAAPCAGIY